MESLVFELNRAVTITSTYGDLKTKKVLSYDGLSIQHEDEGNIMIYVDDKPLAKKNGSNHNGLTDRVNWEILNTDPEIVDKFYNKVNEMTIRLTDAYFESNFSQH